MRVRGERQHKSSCSSSVKVISNISELRFGYFYGWVLLFDTPVIMLNILLSALIDPDRRLRSFRRSERLASILVCITLGACLTMLYLFNMWTCPLHFVPDPVNPYGTMYMSHPISSSDLLQKLVWLQVLDSFVCFDPVLGVIWLYWRSSSAYNPIDVSATLSWLYFSFVGLCLVGINPLDHLHCCQSLLHTHTQRK